MGITVIEAALRLGVSPARVRQLIQSKELPAKPFGPAWVIEEEFVDAFVRQPPGRKARAKSEPKPKRRRKAAAHA